VVQVLVPPAAAVLLMPIAWTFADQGEIYRARDAVAKAAGDKLPYFAFSEADPIYAPVIIGLVGSFTPRAWWIRCQTFPDCTVRSVGHDMMMVVSSNSDTSEVAHIASSGMPELAISDANLIYRSRDDFSVYSFTIPKLPKLIPASKLSSQVGSVESTTRVATQGTNAGYLTLGPYATVDPGRYEVTFKYQSEGESGTWDVVTREKGAVAKGGIPDSHGAAADIVVAIDLPNGADDFHARTWYSGDGRLTVLSLQIRRLGGSSPVQ
jgi:hypothetical protein